MTRSIHEATLYSVQLLLALTPFCLLLSTLFALALGLYTVSLKVLNEEKKEPHELQLANKLRKARDFAELSAIFGVAHEEHVVTTPDGYLLMDTTMKSRRKRRDQSYSYNTVFAPIRNSSWP